MRSLKSNEDKNGMICFDTLQFAKRAEEAGYTKTQAEFQAVELSKIINDNLATKEDLKAISHSLDLLRKDILGMEERLISKISSLENRIVIKMGSMMVIALGVLYTLLKFT